jgi:hypothetical protein
MISGLLARSCRSDTPKRPDNLSKLVEHLGTQVIDGLVGRRQEAARCSCCPSAEKPNAQPEDWRRQFASGTADKDVFPKMGADDGSVGVIGRLGIALRGSMR